MTDFAYIIWNANPNLFSIGTFTPRIYGLLFALGFLISQQVLVRMLKSEAPEGEKFKKRAEKDVETLTIYLVVATIVGARLGHVLFYEPDKYFSNPISILKVWEGGLASHGAAVAILIAFWIFAKRHKHWTYLQVADRVVIVVAITGCLIRLGNFMNSEIYGHATQSNYGVVFTRHATEAFTSRTSPVTEVEFEKHEKKEEGKYVPMTLRLKFKRGVEAPEMQSYITNNVQNILSGRYSYISDHVTYDTSQPIQYRLGNQMAEIEILGIPRHPTQLYESLTSLLLFFLLFYIWSRYKQDLPMGVSLDCSLLFCLALDLFMNFLRKTRFLLKITWH